MHCRFFLTMFLASWVACVEPIQNEGYPPLPIETEGAIRACVDGECSHATVASALAAASDGATVTILPGVYRDGGILRADRVRIEAEGAHLFEATWEDKASLVIKGGDTVIEGLRCSHIRVPDGNGACVRAEGENLTLRRVRFHDAQSGLLSGNRAGRIVIEDSTFERLGNREGEAGSMHGIYIGSIEELVLRRSHVVASTGEGHEVKSRAARTVIEDSIIASIDGVDSRQIDLPNGGEIIVRRNVLEKGPNSTRRDVIAIGMERGRDDGLDHDVNRALIENNTVILDRRGRNVLVAWRDVPEPVNRGNVVIGGRRRVGADNHWIRDRENAGLPPFPFVPPEPLEKDTSTVSSR